MPNPPTSPTALASQIRRENPGMSRADATRRAETVVQREHTTRNREYLDSLDED